MPTVNGKALVLLSGGIDSTTCLHEAIRVHDADNVHAVSINYGQRHVKEIEYAKDSCTLLNVSHSVETISLPSTMLTDPDVEIPNASYEDLPEGVSPTYVPFRNGNLLSRAAAIAQANEFGYIYFGAHAEDALNWAYPDCTPEFIGAMANAIYIGTYHKTRLVTPLEWLTKEEIILMGTALNVRWGYTWSCYAGGKNHCGTCPTCRARRQGFIDAAVHDPTVYQDEVPEEA